MSLEYKAPLYVETLPRELSTELEKLDVIHMPEFEEHTILLLSGQLLRDLFSALVIPESKRDINKFFQYLGILQREHQYLQIITEYYNKVHAK
jgi:hypothetical protein